MSAASFLLILSFGICFNLVMVSHLMRHRRKEVVETYRRQDEVARLVAEAVRILAVNQDTLLAATNKVADRLLKSDRDIADRLEVATAKGMSEYHDDIKAQTVLAADAAKARHTSQQAIDEIRDVVTGLATDEAPGPDPAP